MGLFTTLALLFVVVPVAELAILIQLGQAFGLVPTLLLVLSTGVLGASLARAEGLRAFLRFQGEVASGGVPNQSIFDGMFVLLGGALLLTPGLLTDVVGFTLLVPTTRRWLQRFARARLARMAANGSIRVVTLGSAPPPGWPVEPNPPDGGATAGLDPSKEIAVENG